MDADGIELFLEGMNVVTACGTPSHVVFKFSGNLSVYEYYGNMLLRLNVLPWIRHGSVHIHLDESMSYEDSLEMIDQELRDWPILDCHEPDRRGLIEQALDAANILLASMPPQHNFLVIPFRIEISCRRIVCENRAMELMARESMEEAGYQMVPAADPSIESLKMRTLTSCEDDESCSICLENFYVDCEVASMPCSHVFHEDCIKKWLKSSHYCPICRFEMPTSNC